VSSAAFRVRGSGSESADTVNEDSIASIEYSCHRTIALNITVSIVTLDFSDSGEPVTALWLPDALQRLFLFHLLVTRETDVASGIVFLQVNLVNYVLSHPHEFLHPGGGACITEDPVALQVVKRH
jgi:hypothetical protein